MFSFAMDATRRWIKRLAAPCVAAGLLLFTPLSAPHALAVPLEFAYQAQILDSTTGQPMLSDDVSITIRLYNQPESAVPVLTQFYPNLDLSETNAYVNLAIDASSLDFDGNLWLEVEIDDNTDSNQSEFLRPRQQIFAVPYALKARSVDGFATDELRDYADQVAAEAEQRANEYTDQRISELDLVPGETGVSRQYVEDAFDTFNRTIFVNAAITQSDEPTGALYNPFDNLNDAYAYARTLPNAGVETDRIIVYLMPGQFFLTSTLVMDTPGIDVVGFNGRTAFIRGTVNPLIRFTAGGQGANLRNVVITPTGGTNRALDAQAGGRIDNAEFSRLGAPADGGELIRVNMPNGAGDDFRLLMSRVEVHGGMNVLSCGSLVRMSDGFVNGLVRSTAAIGANFNETIEFNNLTRIGSLDVQPGAPYGIVTLNGVGMVNGVSYTGNTLLRASNTNFVNASTAAPLILPDPNVGTRVVNSVARLPVGGWSGTVTESPANITNHLVYAEKTGP